MQSVAYWPHSHGQELTLDSIKKTQPPLQRVVASSVMNDGCWLLPVEPPLP